MRLTQTDLDNIITFANQARRLNELLDRAAGQSLDALAESCAEVEPGVHTADVEVFTVRGVRYQALLIDGVERYVRVAGGVQRLRGDRIRISGEL